MRHIGSAGANYGLKFNLDKVEVLPARCNAEIGLPNCTQVKQKEALVYLDSLINADGKMGAELSRRIGAVGADFRTLCKNWRHPDLDTSKKLQIFEACVASKLMYCLRVKSIRRFLLQVLKQNSEHPTFIHKQS
eukprot:TRINITY_DN13078_c0_g1_i1.p1 TRINITY_DN13078_c0_g1~~TRINITY_DN13078_c0_g1_i1.p1  ORF type:complete len:134 (-),score=19.10 TRINITY_DN13078_c0_g1_i1:447-848(-)